MSALRRALRDAGLDRDIIVGVTPYITLRSDAGLCLPSRGAEISAWLGEHPEVTAHMVIDDDLVRGHPFVYVSGGHPNGGLQDRHVDEGIALLGCAA